MPKLYSLFVKGSLHCYKIILMEIAYTILNYSLFSIVSKNVDTNFFCSVKKLEHLIKSFSYVLCRRNDFILNPKNLKSIATFML